MAHHFPCIPGQGRILIRKLKILEVCQPQPNSRQRDQVIHEQTMDIPLSLTSSIRIPPHTIVVAIVECAKPLDSTMDIRADAGFLRDFP